MKKIFGLALAFSIVGFSAKANEAEDFSGAKAHPGHQLIVNDKGEVFEIKGTKKLTKVQFEEAVKNLNTSDAVKKVESSKVTAVDADTADLKTEASWYYYRGGYGYRYGYAPYQSYWGYSGWYGGSYGGYYGGYRYGYSYGYGYSSGYYYSAGYGYNYGGCRYRYYY